MRCLQASLNFTVCIYPSKGFTCVENTGLILGCPISDEFSACAVFDNFGKMFAICLCCYLFGVGSTESRGGNYQPTGKLCAAILKSAHQESPWVT